jgi:hypothetical protein
MVGKIDELRNQDTSAVSHWLETETALAFLRCRIFERKNRIPLPDPAGVMLNML